MSLTITLHAWYLLAYAAVGALLYFPLALRAWWTTHQRGRFVTFWTYRRFAWSTRRRVARMLRDLALTLAFWPLGLWEAFR